MKIDAIERYIQVAKTIGVNCIREREDFSICRFWSRECRPRIVLPIVVPLLTLSLVTQAIRGVGSLFSGLITLHGHKIKSGVTDIVSVIIQALALVVLLPLSLYSPTLTSQKVLFVKGKLLSRRLIPTPSSMISSPLSPSLSSSSSASYCNWVRTIIEGPLLVPAAICNSLRDFTIGMIAPGEKSVGSYLCRRIGNLFWVVMSPMHLCGLSRPRDVMNGNTHALNGLWRKRCP